MNLLLSGNSWAKELRLLPENTCAPTPMRIFGLFDHARASLMSLIAPRTRFLSVTVTVSVGAPTISVRVRLVSVDRSRNVEEPKPRVQDWPIGRTPATTGNLAVVVLALPDDVVTLRNSGEYWKKSAAEPTPASAAGW